MSGAATRPELVEALRSTLREHGWSGATMERIAAAAGLSRVTLHRQGVTKQGLFAALVEGATERYREAMWPALTGDGSASQRLEEALAALCTLAESELELLVALRAQADAVFHKPGDPEQLTRSVFTEPLEKILRDGAADQSIDSGDPAETATVLFNLVGWAYVHLRTGHNWSPERALRSTLSVALRGLLAR
jgi:AcrR family transcriptional regulator